jgi:aquaporin Z
VYILVELLGACLAVASVQLLRPEESSDDGAFPTDYSLRSKLFGEGIGTFMVVFTVGLNVLGLSKSAALSIGAALTSMIYAIGDISGGHFNPAVTVAVLASGKGDQNARKAVRYIGAQLVAGILAAFTYAVAHRGSTFPLGPGLGYNWVGVGIVETLFTFVLTLIVLCVVISHKSNVREFDGFIIGACVVSGGFAAGSISGGSLNPAVSCGISASHIRGGGLFWKASVYSMFELLGALVAAGVFRILHLNSAETNDVLRF